MRRTLFTRTAPLAVALALALGACSDDGGTDKPSAGASETAEATLEVTIKDGAITPNGERLDVGIDEEITLTITSDVDGEFHVHSTPEQEVTFTEGTTTATLSFDRPGVVEMEAHDPALVVAMFEVR